MKSSDRTILFAIAAAVAVGALWFLLIAPKREEASTLGKDVDDAQVAVEQAQQLAATAEAAKADYKQNYHRLVVLGKAAPSDDDTASLFVELDHLSASAGTQLQAIELSQSSASTVPQTAAQETTTDQNLEASQETASDAALPATEAAAALLPLGAAIGPAGLPVMPYELTVKGNYFQIRDLIDGLQKLVGSKQGRQIVNGRLVTIDGFSFEGDGEKGFPELDATLNVTTYLSPAEQGVTPGASPTAPPTTTTTDSTAVTASDTSTTAAP